MLRDIMKQYQADKSAIQALTDEGNTPSNVSQLTPRPGSAAQYREWYQQGQITEEDYRAILTKLSGQN